MSMWFRWSVLCMAMGLVFGASETALAGWPKADQMQDVRKLAQQLVVHANNLTTAIKKEWPNDSGFIERASDFANRSQHLVNISSVAIDKKEDGRHTQSAYGEMRAKWDAVKAHPSMPRIEKWNERNQIHDILVKLEPFYK